MEKEFRRRVQKYLIELDLEIEESIRNLTSYEYPKEVCHLDFELFSDRFTDGSPIRVFFLDKNDNEFFDFTTGKAEYPSSINPKLLNIDFVYPLSLEEEFENKIEDYDPWAMATEEFIKWFSHKWLLMKAEHFNLDATIGSHSSWEKFNLMKQKWVDTSPW